MSVRLARINGRNGYDISVNCPSATVADYIQALNQAIIELPLDRSRDYGLEQCRGCDFCCRERLPLTSIDVKALMTATGENDLNRFLGKYTQVSVIGRTADITMVRDDERCVFLDSRLRLCQRYDCRPLACQTFICSPLTQRAEVLREVLINTGEDELVRWWMNDEDTERCPVIHEGFLAGLSDIDILPTSYSGKESYRQVILKEACPADLWRELRSDSTGSRGKRRAGYSRRGY